MEEKRKDSVFIANNLVDWSSLQAGRGSIGENRSNDQIVSEDIPGLPLGPEDFRAADSVEGIFHFKVDPIHSAGLFEGDIDNVSVDDLAFMRSPKNAIIGSGSKWPENTIPYLISSSFSQKDRAVIAKAMKEYHDKTCIRFQPRTSEKAYIHIIKGQGCSSSIGRTGSQQTVSLGDNCVYAGIVMHELMHAAGFFHEQSRTDRDDFITINWGNIQSGMENNFLKYDLTEIRHLGATYDTCSLMHYGANAFSKGDQPTIELKNWSECKLGQRERLSDIDIRKLNTLYQCVGYPQITCENYHKDCALWVENDECSKNPSYMLPWCPLACKQCERKCENTICAFWVQQGECENNRDFMATNCPEACGFCQLSDSCSNENNRICEDWAQKGECDWNGDFLNPWCAQACGFCTAGTIRQKRGRLQGEEATGLPFLLHQARQG